jgi:hypothetical protein
MYGSSTRIAIEKTNRAIELGHIGRRVNISNNIVQRGNDHHTLCLYLNTPYIGSLYRLLSAFIKLVVVGGSTNPICCTDWSFTLRKPHTSPIHCDGKLKDFVERILLKKVFYFKNPRIFDSFSFQLVNSLVKRGHHGVPTFDPCMIATARWMRRYLHWNLKTPRWSTWSSNTWECRLGISI